MNSKKITYKILIADDHPLYIEGIKSLLKNEKGIFITKESINGQDALKAIQDGMEIDLLITDINMPGMSGIELTKEVKRQFPEIKVLVLTIYNEWSIINEIIMAEAEGYILKNSGKKEILEAINQIMDNGVFFSKEVLQTLNNEIKKEKSIQENTKYLTRRELEIIMLIVQELSTKQIAGKLFISPRTVDTHRKNILFKTQCKTLVGLITYALKNEIGN